MSSFVETLWEAAEEGNAKDGYLFGLSGLEACLCIAFIDRGGYFDFMSADDLTRRTFVMIAAHGLLIDGTEPSEYYANLLEAQS